MRLIDADALKRLVDEEWFDCKEKSEFLDEINRTPTIPITDAVPVVRCKDCKRHNAKARDLYRCDLLNVWHDGDFFCADGERNEE